MTQHGADDVSWPHLVARVLQLHAQPLQSLLPLSNLLGRLLVLDLGRALPLAQLVHHLEGQRRAEGGGQG